MDDKNSMHSSLLDEDNKDETNRYTINVNSNTQYFIKNEKQLTNRICTSKYNPLNAFPKIIWEQFSKSSNIYFLILAILQMVPSITQSGPTILMPLIFVVAVNGVKDFWEDYKRKVSDNRENKTNCLLFSENGFIETEWLNIKPGNILKIRKDEYFPADLIMLYSTNKNGNAYVETKNLDGETNLKYKESIKRIHKKLKSKDDKESFIKNVSGEIKCEFPNPNMYYYEGTYFYANPEDEIYEEDNPVEHNESKRNNVSGLERLSKLDDLDDKYATSNIINLDYNNLLLRGSSLRNTEYIIGIVVYAGHFSKIMLNSLNARTKHSRLFKIMNSQLYYIIMFQVLLCFSFSIIYRFYDEFHSPGIMDFIKNLFYTFFAWLLTTNNIVPISLLVTVEMIKFCQALFIGWDHKIYDINNDRAAIVQSSALNEELGMVKHIFSDKTGTLTKNIMQFKYMVINETLYGSEERNYILI
jgi:phospholipid-transporting ATPase